MALRTVVRPARESWPPRTIVRRSAGLRTIEATLHRSGLGPIAGADEAGRGACAGPLVIAACVLAPRPQSSLAGLDDSKRLTEPEREALFPVIKRLALAWSVIAVPAWEIDTIGLHVSNIEGMRRAVSALDPKPEYVLTDGFRVPGLPAPSLAVVGGDASAACIAAASILAKVTRDRIMVEMDKQIPGYGFAIHKGYSTAIHTAALAELGPSSEHRLSFRNVRGRRFAGADGLADPLSVDDDGYQPMPGGLHYL
ncbi:ribonuclease HII [Smaragdicoccus niigatensis]|uniref:ribonuclease HII n=1 Tax=Smaragdicoccus niigatensis TaxID=359359 RepID=UPI00035C9861|nr:ribonuclease HII [Smaragdicoccus niigatensis]